jgi:pimeloyl-ACP methyl ester carboxylesterase
MNETCADVHQATKNHSGMAKVRAVDVGGRRLALTCSGKGTPTVVLETGLGADSHEWSKVYQGIEGVTRVLSYDRAGRGASDAAPGQRDALQMVSDLHHLLQVADIPGPYILVGHSFGGLLMRLFAHQYGASVVGVVLVDSMHEDQFDLLGPLFPPASPSEPPALRNVRTFWSGGWRDPNATVERIDLVSSTDQGRKIVSLGSIPVHVIVAGAFLNQPSLPQEHRATLQRRWEDLQRRFLGLSSNATCSVVRSSGHFIQRDDPGAVIGIIQKAVAAARCRPISTLAGD